jgi:hypothetical protein
VNARLLTLSAIHQATWARLGQLDDDESYADGPTILRQLRSIEDEALPLQVHSYADLAAKARIAATYVDGGDEETLSFVVAALAKGIESLARAGLTPEPSDEWRVRL